MDNRPIGVFDSGLGGLTAVREIHRILPGEDIIYFGDTGRVPYGARSRDTLRLFAGQIIAYLRRQNVKAVIVACGSISTNLADECLVTDMPHVTVLEPTVRRALCQTKNRRVGIIATQATIRTGMFEDRLKEADSNILTYGQACPLLVPVIEHGLTDFNNQITRLTLEMYLRPVIDFGADTIILGCTHYSLLAHIIRDMLKDKISLIDSGACAAMEFRSILESEKLLANRAAGQTTYYSTDSAESFAETARLFLEQDISEQVRYVEIETIENTLEDTNQ